MPKNFPRFKSCLETVFPLSLFDSSSETQGQIVGAGKSLNGREKNSGQDSQEAIAREDKLFRTSQFQTVGEVLASDWCQKSFVFSAQSQSSKTRSCFVCSYTKDTYRPVDRHICLGRLPRSKVSIHSTKCREDRPAYPRETCRKYAGPFAGIVTLTLLLRCHS